MTPALTALDLATLGYHVIPLAQGQKAAVDRNWPALRLSIDAVRERWDENPDYGVGLLLGTEVAPGVFLVAIDIDVDDDTLIERVRLALPGPAPSKRGSKGRTFIARTTVALKKILIKRPKEALAIIEILAHGQQTVLPPSIHPKGMPFHWVDHSLLGVPPTDLPLIDAAIIREIEMTVKNPGSKIFLLNEMHPQLGQEPGNMHNYGVEATASMIALGFTDDQIQRRVMRAMQRADAEYNYPDRDYDAERRSIAEWCKSARDKQFDRPATERREKLDVTAARWLVNEWKGPNLVFSRGGQLLAYTDGIYKNYPPDRVQKVLGRECPVPEISSMGSRAWTETNKTAVALAPDFPENTAHHRVCLANGTLDLDTGILHPWSPDDYLISRLDFAYDPEAQCPIWDAFRQQTFQIRLDPNGPNELGVPLNPSSPLNVEECSNAFEEFLAMSLFECHQYHKFLVLEGVTRSGKSVLAHVARSMHSPDAVAAVAVHDLGEESSRTGLVGKLLNITGETSTVNVVADDYLKLIVAGEPVEVRYLYQGTFHTVLPTRFIVATNEPLRTRDASGAVLERMLVIACNNYLEPEQRDDTLPSRLRDERPGIMNRLVVAWRRLVERRRFQPPHSSRELSLSFEEDNNPSLKWLLERTHQGIAHQNPTYTIPSNVCGYTMTDLLYQDYAAWSKANGMQPLSSMTFATRLSQIRRPGIDTNSVAKYVGGRSQRCRLLSLVNTTSY